MMELAAAARILGDDRPGQPALTEVGYLREINKGLDLTALTRLSDQIAPDDPKFKYRIVSKTTLARIKLRVAGKTGRRLNSQQSVVVVRIADIWGQALRIWQTPVETRDFLNRPHALLGGRKPLDLVLENELGANLVRSVLGRLENGSAV